LYNSSEAFKLEILVANCGGWKNYNKQMKGQQQACDSFEMRLDSRLLKMLPLM
jgi:hypothetical protein